MVKNFALPKLDRLFSSSA